MAYAKNISKWVWGSEVTKNGIWVLLDMGQTHFGRTGAKKHGLQAVLVVKHRRWQDSIFLKINTCLNIVLFKDLPCLCAASLKNIHLPQIAMRAPTSTSFHIRVVTSSYSPGTNSKKNILSLLIGRVFSFTSWTFIEHPLLCFGGASRCIFFRFHLQIVGAQCFSTPSPIYSTYVCTSNGSNLLDEIGG